MHLVKCLINMALVEPIFVVVPQVPAERLPLMASVFESDEVDALMFDAAPKTFYEDIRHGSLRHFQLALQLGLLFFQLVNPALFWGSGCLGAQGWFYSDSKHHLVQAHDDTAAVDCCKGLLCAIWHPTYHAGRHLLSKC